MTTTKTRKIKLNIPRPANLKFAQQQLVLKVLAANRWVRNLAADELGISIRHMTGLIAEFKANGINIPYNQTRAEPRAVMHRPKKQIAKLKQSVHDDVTYLPIEGA